MKISQVRTRGSEWQRPLIGPKVDLAKLIGRELVIVRYRELKSTQNDLSRIDIRLKIENNGEWMDCITWCASKVLMKDLQSIPIDSYPFLATI